MKKSFDLRQKKVIDADTAEQIGYIRGMDIDFASGKILSVTIPKNGFSWLFNEQRNLTVYWDEVLAIGSEYVLVRLRNPSKSPYEKLENGT